MIIQKKLPNGLRIVAEKIPFVRSVSVGIWVGTGSRFERPEENGISHFIEHMLFKGTESRTAKEVAETIENIGGQLNAFTGKECTCYYTKTLDNHLSIAVDLLADMMFRPKLEPKDIDLERKVIIEEIGMYEDSPEELVHDLLSETAWNGDPLGFPILGTVATLEGINRETILKYMSEHYTPDNCVVAVAGNFDEHELDTLIHRYFADWKGHKSGDYLIREISYQASRQIRTKDTEQVHLCVGFNGVEHGHDDMYSLLTMNNVFGGGMSSRLFQKIREELGLVYSIYSYPAAYRGAGLFAVYAGMNPDYLEQVATLIIQETEKILREKLSPEELIKSREQLKGNYILGLESTSSRMNTIGKSELLLGRVHTQEEVMENIDRVSMEDVTRVTSQVLRLDQVAITAVGAVKESDKFWPL